MLSKPVAEPKYTYKDISKIDLTKSKLLELKQYARDLNIKVSGNKDEIKLRIQKQIINDSNSVIIQKTFRRHLAQKWFKKVKDEYSFKRVSYTQGLIVKRLATAKAKAQQQKKPR